MARFSFEPTRRHWNGIKHIFRYLQGTIDLRLFYSNETTSPRLVWYNDARYKSDPHKAPSKIGYLFWYNDIAISRCSTKQTLVATSTNHFEITFLYETRKECVWLRFVISHIQSFFQMTSVNNSPTIIYEDNVACVVQVREWYIKGDKTKHISPKFFYTHELKKVDKLMLNKFSLLIIL